MGGLIVYKDWHYVFRNEEHIIEALTHASCVGDSGIVSNQRMEWLGDMVINLVVGQILWEEHPFAKEGELTNLKARLTCNRNLSEWGRAIGLQDRIILSRDLLGSSSHQLMVIRGRYLADAFEAFCGAVYLDGGYQDLITLVKLLKEDVSCDISG